MYRGKKRRLDCPAHGNPSNTLPPSKRRDLWDIGTTHVRTLTHPLRFNTWGTKGRRAFRDALAGVVVNETLEREARTRVIDDVKCEGDTY